MPSVSVIVPVYNAEKYICRCVDSILAQTFADFELILVNDGSSDRSGEILQEYEKKDTRVCVITQENQGPDYARKKGVESARGNYLVFCDADDYVGNAYLEHLIISNEDGQYDVVAAQIQRFDSNGKIWSEISNIEENILLQNISDIMKEYFVTRRLTGAYYGKLIKRNLFDGYAFQKETIIGEDIAAMLHVLQKSNNVKLIPNADYYYFWNLESISHMGYTERHKASLEQYIQLRDGLLSKKYIKDSYIEAYFAEYEMAVITAMSRNWQRDCAVIRKLRKDLSPRLASIWENASTGLYLKISIALFECSPWVFMSLYRMLYLLTGR